MDFRRFVLVLLCSLIASTVSQGPAKRTRVVTSILESPYLMLKPSTDRPLVGNDRFEGFLKDLMDLVSRRAGFDYSFSLVKDGRYGSFVNGTWNGMIGELIRNEADLAAAGLIASSMRQRVVDFSQPFMVTGVSILMHTNDVFVTHQPQIDYINVFKPEIWVLVVIAILLVVLVLYLIRRFDPYETSEVKTEGDRVMSSFWMVCGGLLLQGFDKRPKSVAGFILLSAWWLFSLGLFVTFLVTMIDIQMVRPADIKTMKIGSLHDLNRTPDIQIGTIQSGSTRAFFCYSKIRIFHEICLKLRQSSVRTTAEGIKRVKQGRYAFLADSATIDYTTSRECDLMKIGANLNRVYKGLATPLGSDLKDHVNLAILELIESGDIDKLYQKWWYTKGVCPRVKSTRRAPTVAGPVKIKEMSALFICLLIGLGVTAIAMVIEIIYYRLKAKKPKHTEKTPKQAEAEPSEDSKA